MSDVATFVRIFEASPSDDLVTKRVQAAKDIAARYVKKNTPVDQLLSMADNIAAAAIDIDSVDDAFADEVAKLITDQSPSYVRDGHELELAVMTLVGANQLLTPPRGQSAVLTSQDVLAGALWSALGYQAARTEQKFESLRTSVLQRARSWAMEAAENSRRRVTMPEVVVKVPDSADINAVPGMIKSATQNVIAALRDNATLDREEINMLWWALSDHSTYLNAPYGRPPEHVGAVAAGIELAQLLRRLPADAHRHLVVRHTKGAKRYALSDVIDGLGENRTAIAAMYSEKAAVENCPHVFPLMTAIVDGQSEDDGKLTASEWGARALLEASLLNAQNMVNG